MHIYCKAWLSISTIQLQRRKDLVHVIIGKARLMCQAKNASTPQMRLLKDLKHSLHSAEPVREASSFDTSYCLLLPPTMSTPPVPLKPCPTDKQILWLSWPRVNQHLPGVICCCPGTVLHWYCRRCCTIQRCGDDIFRVPRGHTYCAPAVASRGCGRGAHISLLH